MTETRSAESSSSGQSRTLKSGGSVLVGTLLTQPSSLLPNYFIRSSQSTARFRTTKMGTPGPSPACTSFSLRVHPFHCVYVLLTVRRDLQSFRDLPRTSSLHISSVVCLTPSPSLQQLPTAARLSSSECGRME